MTSNKNNGSLIAKRNLLPTTSFLDNFFDGAWPSLNWANNTNAEQMPAANVAEKEKEYAVELSVPGYEKKDIQVEVDSNNVLHIVGERDEELKEENENYTRREFNYGSFNRSFQLPETVNDQKISAKCKNGVLTLALPKKDTALLTKKVKEIKIV